MVKPKIFWDVDFLENLSQQLGDECVLLCLSPISFHMLTDMAEMLNWHTRFTSDEVPEIAREAYKQMSLPCDLDELFESIGNIEETVTSLESEFRNMNIHVNCGCGCGCGCNGGSGDVPDSSSPVDLPVDPTDIPNPQNEQVCKAAHSAYNSWERFLTEILAELQVGASFESILDLIAASFAGGVLTFTAAIAWTLLALIFGGTAVTLVTQALAYLQTKKDEFICSLFTATNAIEGKANGQALLLDDTLPFQVRMIFWYMILASNYDVIYDGTLDVSEIVDVSCDCGGVPPTGCTDTGGGIYPIAPAGWCYQAITGISGVVIAGTDEGQEYEIQGRNFRVHGVDHPGLVNFGFTVGIGSRPVGSGGFVCTFVENGLPMNGRWGNNGDQTLPLVPSSTLVPDDTQQSMGFDNAIPDMVTHKDLFDLSIQINADGVGGTEVFFGPANSGSLETDPYDMIFTDMAWLVPV